MEELVNVLISTYNGEKYIKDQIDSILGQTYPNIRIYVRDDGSSDNTCNILKEYEKAGKIVLFRGDNVKWGKSFLTLLKKAETGSYWAFSDQDDVWLPDKIKWAVEWMKKQDQTKPLLFHSSYKLMSADMENELGICTAPKYKFDFRRSLTDCLYQGFSIVINGECRRLMLDCEINNLTSHDWWACLLITKFGESYYDNRIASLHRRLDISMSSSKLSSKFKWLWKTLSTGNSDIRSCAQEFVRIYSPVCNDHDIEIASWFCGEKYSLLKSIKKAFYPKRWRPNISSELVIRFLMLIGKI